tara:strand:+ start:122 stop:241 length:120 start_codon:yes stop_codon:yes gene_type:complete
MTKEINAWAAQRNKKQVEMKWRFKTKDSRIKLKHLYPVI